MPATLRWNRLSIAASTEDDFLSSVAEYFPQLLELPYDELELDITGSVDISEDAFRSIAIKLISGETADLKMTIRIPEEVDRYFRHANLYRMVSIEVVNPAPVQGSHTPDSVKAAIDKGEYQAINAPATDDAPSDLSPEAPSLEPDKPPPAPKPEKKSPPAWIIDSSSGARYEVKERMLVGREAPSDLVYQVPTISKRHFLIRQADGGYVIEDMRSTNGTYLNGLPVHETMPLRDGDEIVVAITLKHPKGACIFQFTTKPE